MAPPAMCCWQYKQKLNEDLVAKQTHSPVQPRHRHRLRQHLHGHARWQAGGHRHEDRQAGVGDQAGQLREADRWLPPARPLLVKDTVVIGAQGGEWPDRGPIFGVDAKTGKQLWRFYTAGGEENNGDARSTLAKQLVAAPAAAAAGCPAADDPRPNTVWWGTANPAPLYDWSGPDYKTSGARPGDNPYTTSVILLDPDTGKLKGYHQELPHDAWDFDSAHAASSSCWSATARSTPCIRARAASSGCTTATPRCRTFGALVKNITFVKEIKPDGHAGRPDAT